MKLIVANLKMNLLCGDIKEYKMKLENSIQNSEIVVCPTSLYLPFFRSDKYKIGSQNCYFEESGAFTGETSCLQLKSIGVSHVIAGHSERRQHFLETNETINKKNLTILKNGLKLILCVGETKLEKLENDTFEVINKQINECLADIHEYSNVIVAYEPIWSIGTGMIPKLEEIREVAEFIKKVIKEKHNQDVKVLYGGSVDLDNIEDINTLEEVDGILIGSASVDIDNFIKIIEKYKQL